MLLSDLSICSVSLQGAGLKGHEGCADGASVKSMQWVVPATFVTSQTNLTKETVQLKSQFECHKKLKSSIQLEKRVGGDG